MRITSKGQVTIPQDIRERHGFLPDSEIEFVETDDRVFIERTKPTRRDRADRAITALLGSGARIMSTDELLALTRE